MPFSLGDLKRSYGRSGAISGPADVRPLLLVGKERRAWLPRLDTIIQWYERQRGARRRDVDLDDLAPLAGDYRLARCFASCLQSEYRFASPSFERAVVGETPGQGRHLWTKLNALGIRSSSDLRLAVFEHVSAQMGGAVSPPIRTATLTSIGERLGLPGNVLDDLLWLDADSNEVLDREGALPSAEWLAAVYNRRAVETMLVRTLWVDLLLPSPDGAAIRMLYAHLKFNGLLCDLDQVVDTAHDRRQDGRPPDIQAHVFGPLQVFGPRTRQGDGFARAVLGLVHRFPQLRAEARVLVNEREYLFRLGPEVAEAVAGAWGAEGVTEDQPNAEDEVSSPVAVVAQPDVSAQFDSTVESRLYATLRGMERRGETRGWHLEREPEPLVVAGTVLVPDFGMARERQRDGTVDRVFVEVIGFWTPAYRERKRAKLAAVRGHAELVLAVQEKLAGDFADLGLPMLTYRERVSATALVDLLDRQYRRAEDYVSDAAETLADLLESLSPGTAVLTEHQAAVALGVSDARALNQIFATVALPEPWVRVPGLGTCQQPWLDQVDAICRAAAGSDAAVALERLEQAITAAELPYRSEAAFCVEPLLLALGHSVSWASLLEATVRLRSPEGAPSTRPS